MFWLVLGIIFLIGAFLFPVIWGKKKMGVVISVTLACVALVMLIGQFIMVVSPGQIVKVYPLGGGDRVLSVGYNFVPVWDRKESWDGTLYKFVFLERGDERDPNDAFGGQTANGDYMTTVANVSVRIDPDRLDAYIAMFGSKSIGEDLGVMLKGVLKDSFERCLEQYPTEEVMANKSKITADARSLALARIADNFPVIVGELTYPDIVASPEYEAAIRQKAAIRMETEQFQLESERNAQQAEANRIKAKGEAEVVRIAAEAQAKAELEIARGESSAEQERARGRAAVLATDTEAKAVAVERIAKAEAAAMLERATAESSVNRLLGETYNAFPILQEFRRLEITENIGQRWNGMIFPSLGSDGGSFNFMNLTTVFERFMEMAQAQASLPKTVSE